MKKVSFLFFAIIFLGFASNAFALEDPRTVPNNKFGIHILFPDEIKDASKLVNSAGGDWGYITIPIQAGDKDLNKWQKFMDDAKKFHLIPLVRLASEGDYFNTKVWRKPNYTDILDFANFLNSLDWPTKNKYILVFNEPNRGDEWGGKADPGDYAQVLSYAVSVFKSKSPDFFIISAGMDNAAENTNTSINEYDFFSGMNSQVKGIFYQVDGFGSHSYPNPAFAQPPYVQTRRSISSFRFEKSFIESLGAKDLPIFITETGWSKNEVDENYIGRYYKEAFENTWNDKDIVAVTPFLLKAGAGPFMQFSFFDNNGNFSIQSNAFAEIKKTKGTPSLNEKVLGEKANGKTVANSKNFADSKPLSEKISISSPLRNFLKWLLKI